MKKAINGARQEKKPTNAQLERRIKNATVHLDRTKDTKTIFFSDKGLRLTVDENEGYAVIETGYHRHVFSSFTAAGVSRPFLYTARFVDIALAAAERYDITEDGGYSMKKLMEVLHEQEDRTEYNIAWYYDLYCYNIFAPLYSIDESEAGSFIVYEQYMHNVARNSFLLGEHKEDVTNKEFVDKILETEKSFLEGLDETVIIKGKTDEQRVEEEVAAIQEQETEEQLKQ